MKPIYIILIILGTLVLGGGLLFFLTSGKSLYIPGMVSDESNLRNPLTPPEQAGADSGRWKVAPDINLYHFSTGEGTPVLFIHGYALSPPLEPLRGLTALEEYSPGYEVHYYHQRGCGYSTRPLDTFESTNFYRNMMEMNSKLGAAANLADIERIRRILKVEKLIIIGHSYGGFLAALYASEFPGRVEKLVLVAPANVLRMPQENKGLYDAVQEYLPDELRDEYSQWLKEHFDYKNIWTKSEKGLAVHNLKMSDYYGIAAEAMGMPVTDEYGVKTDPDLAGGWLIHAYNFSFGKRYDLRPVLNRLSMPVLIFQGEKDLTGIAEIQDYLDGIPGAELALIDSGHFLMDEPAFTGKLAEFLASPEH